MRTAWDRSPPRAARCDAVGPLRSPDLRRIVSNRRSEALGRRICAGPAQIRGVNERDRGRVLTRGMTRCIALSFAIASLAACRLQRSTPPDEPGPPGRGCTMEAKICPDGSAVGRTGPDCAFPPCPDESKDLEGLGPDPAPPSSPNGDPEPVPM